MATQAEVDLVNQALFLTGNEPVQDLSDAALDASVAAVKMLRVKEKSRDAVLSRHGWVEALEYRSLAPAVLDGSATVAPWTNFRYPTVYLLPQDALRVWEVAGQPVGTTGRALEPRWQLGTWETDDGARLVIGSCEDPASAGELEVCYLRRANWASLGAQLKDAIAWDMASRACYAITGDVARTSQLRKEAEEKLQLAIGADGTQEGHQPPLAPSIPAQIRRYAESGGSWWGGGRW